jgi:ArsR family transcriptional regulator
MRDFESALKAAGDPTRTRILKLLEARELCVCQVQAVLGLAPSTVSKHLAILKTAGLVDDQRDGRWIHYSLATEGHNPHAAGVQSLLRGALDRDPMIVADRRRLKEILRVPLTELCGLVPTRPGVRRAHAHRAVGKAGGGSSGGTR